MTTSRTGTAQWRRVRTLALAQAQAASLTHCPCTQDCAHHRGRTCLVRLDYNRTLTPASAEPDHMRPATRGGLDDPANLRIICRRCNQARGNKPLSPAAPSPPPTTTTLLDWQPRTT